MCKCSTRQEQGFPEPYKRRYVKMLFHLSCFLRAFFIADWFFLKKRYFSFGELAKTLIMACAYVGFFPVILYFFILLFSVVVLLHVEEDITTRGLRNLFRALFFTVWPWLGLFALYFQIFNYNGRSTKEVPNTVSWIRILVNDCLKQRRPFLIRLHRHINVNAVYMPKK